MVSELNIERFKRGAFGPYSVPENERTEEILIAVAKRNGGILKTLRDTDKTQHVCDAAVEKDPLMIEHVPVAMQTPEMVLKAVGEDYDSYKLIDESKRTIESSMLAVSGNGMLIQEVPLDQRTKEMYEESVNKNPWAIKHFPIELQTPELVLKLVTRTPKTYLHIHNSKKTVEAAIIAVKDDGLKLEYVPEHQRTKEVCKAAVFKNARAIKFVPIELQTPKLVLRAAENNPLFFKEIDSSKITQESAVLAVKENGLYLQHMPVEVRSKDVCEEAVTSDPMAIEFVPVDLQTPEFVMNVVQQSGVAYSKIHESKRTYESSIQAVKKFGDNLEFVPESHRSREVCLAAVNHSAFSIRFLSPENVTSEVLDHAIDSHYRSYGNGISNRDMFHETFFKYNQLISKEALVKHLDKYPKINYDLIDIYRDSNSEIANDFSMMSAAIKNDIKTINLLGDQSKDSFSILKSFADNSNSELAKFNIYASMSDRIKNILGVKIEKDFYPGQYESERKLPAEIQKISESKVFEQSLIEKYVEKDVLEKADSMKIFQKEVFNSKILIALLDGKLDGLAKAETVEKIVNESLDIKGWRQAVSHITKDAIWPVFRASQAGVEITSELLDKAIAGENDYSAPAGLKDVNPFAGFQKNTYEALCEKFDVSPYSSEKNNSSESAKQIAAYKLAQFFGKDLVKAEKFVNDKSSYIDQGGVDVIKIDNRLQETIRSVATEIVGKNYRYEYSTTYNIKSSELRHKVFEAIKLEFAKSKMLVSDIKASQITESVLRTTKPLSVQLHDAGQFTLPESGQWSREKWVGLVSKAPEAIQFSARFADYESKFGEVASSLNELKTNVQLLSYGDVAEKDKLVAETCAKLNFSEKEFKDVMQHSSNPKSEANLPDIALTGSRELEGFRLRLLEKGDVKALMIGASSLSSCCQRIGGAGEAAAIHSYTSANSGIYAVENIKSGDLIAQSFAWLSNDKKTVVFDSIESKYKDEKHIAVTHALIKELVIELKLDGWSSIISKTDYGMTGEVAKGMHLGHGDKVTVPKMAEICHYLDCEPGEKSFSTDRVIASELLFRTHETQRVGREIIALPKTVTIEWDQADTLKTFNRKGAEDFKTTVTFKESGDKVLMRVTSSSEKGYIADELREFEKHDGNTWSTPEKMNDLVDSAVMMVNQRIEMPTAEREKIIREVTARVEAANLPVEIQAELQTPSSIAQNSEKSQVYLDLVNKNGKAIIDVPEMDRTPEICLAAVKENGRVVIHLNDAQRTKEVCAAALAQSPKAAKYLTSQQMSSAQSVTTQESRTELGQVAVQEKQEAKPESKVEAKNEASAAPSEAPQEQAAALAAKLEASRAARIAVLEQAHAAHQSL